jgi:signal transduction histidine kinase
MLLRDARNPRTYARILYLLLAFPLGLFEFIALVTLIATGIGTIPTPLGIPLLIGTLFFIRALAQLERGLIGSLVGVEIREPYLPDREGGFFQRVRGRLEDPATWKDLGFLLLQLPAGTIAFCVAVALCCAGPYLLLAPAYYWAFPEGMEFGIFVVDTLPEALALVPPGLLLTWIALRLLTMLAAAYGAFARRWLGTDEERVLTEQVVELRGARARMIAAADAERKRLERDLHDGAQQRLVAVALQLGMAERRLREADPDAAELVSGAHAEAEAALGELRDLARGIHPAILTTRGLAPALDDLARRSPVPVEVAERPAERLPEQVEAAVYFVVSESLANVAKHAEAESVEVRVAIEGSDVGVSVRDDGRGGADVAGSGLQGLEDRIGALDGTFGVESPPGAGTKVWARIPRDGFAPGPLDALPEPAIADPARGPGRRSSHGFGVRAGSFAVLGGVIVAIWAASGAGYFWPIWPLIALAAIVALDAVHSLAGSGKPG